MLSFFLKEIRFGARFLDFFKYKIFRKKFYPKDVMEASILRIPPQWDHPLLKSFSPPISEEILYTFSYDYFLRFSKFFRGQLEGSLLPGIKIEFTRKMKNRLGAAHLFDRRIRLNLNYFERNPSLLPYTLFHELVHMWLYDCDFDPGHTKRFYQKMSAFDQTFLPKDKNAHIHKRLSNESKFKYRCSGCGNRWYVNSRSIEKLYCHFCWIQQGRMIYPEAYSFLDAVI